MIEIVEKRNGNKVTNKIRLEFAALSDNESFARMAVAAFITPLNPTLEEMSDVKTAVSEAVTNAVLHGYESRNSMEDRICMDCILRGDVLEVEISDRGIGIENVGLAMEPLYTSKPEQDRSGMGFAFMEAFMDDLEVESEVGCGTVVRMCKKIGTSAWIDSEE
ncbi:MAG: anti-sigma F factor [Lachnospiraceae bacterium]|nr:anti-sigma F factor [Lachnospiraceae bacterium]